MLRKTKHTDCKCKECTEIRNENFKRVAKDFDRKIAYLDLREKAWDLNHAIKYSL